MSSSHYKYKSGIFEITKNISNSNLLERTIENNKKQIKVNLKTNSDLLYQDLTPNKEKTKKIMSNFVNPNKLKTEIKQIEKTIKHNRVNSENISNEYDQKNYQLFSTNNKNIISNKIENGKNNIKNNHIKVNINNFNNVNNENENNNDFKKNLKTIFINSNFDNSKKIFESIQNSFGSEFPNNNYGNNYGNLNTINHDNIHSLNYKSLSNGNLINKNIITKRIILTQSETNIYDSNEKKSPIDTNNHLNDNIKNTHLKKSNSSIISRTNNSYLNNEINNKNNPTTILKIEDLIVLEEKLSLILDNCTFNNISHLQNYCIEWYNYYTYSSFYNIFEDFFHDEQINEKVIAHEYSVLEFLSIIVLYQVVKDQNINQSTINLLNKLIYCIIQNFLITSDYIISILPSYAQKTVWVKKMKKIINKKKDSLINQNEHLNNLRIGNNRLSILLKNILRLYSNNNNIINSNELLFYLNRSTRLYLSTLNEYFKKKIYLDENNINSEDNNLNLENHQTKKNGISNLRNKINLPKKDIKKIFTLVLDLDETIICYNNETKTFIPRPGLNKFLNEISKIYEIILFTSAKQEYADSIIDQIDKNKIYFEKRFYRQHNLIINNSFIKDLSRLKKDLSKVIFLDNKPQSYGLQRDNGIFIKSFHGDEKFDNVLIYLIPILKKIASNPSNDVRKEIKKMKNEIYSKISTDLNNECQ